MNEQNEIICSKACCCAPETIPAGTVYSSRFRQAIHDENHTRAARQVVSLDCRTPATWLLLLNQHPVFVEDDAAQLQKHEWRLLCSPRIIWPWPNCHHCLDHLGGTASDAWRVPGVDAPSSFLPSFFPGFLLAASFLLLAKPGLAVQDLA